MPTYRVDRKDQKPRVVDAPNPAAARQHVARTEISVSKITASDAFKLASEGVKLETAGEETSSPDDETPRSTLSIGQAGGAQQPEIEGEAGKAK